jgi:hypothetical protein
VRLEIPFTEINKHRLLKNCHGCNTRRRTSSRSEWIKNRGQARAGSAVSIAATGRGTLLGQNQKISLTEAVDKNAVGTTNTETLCGLGL